MSRLSRGCSRGDLGVVVAPGNHSVSGVQLKPTPPGLSLLEVMHFPMRTFRQLERKVQAIGTGYDSLPFRSRDVGRDQLKLLALQREDKLSEYLAERCLSDDAVVAGLRSGELVLDRRLARFMAELDLDRSDGLGAISARPDSDVARALVAAALAGSPSSAA